MNIEARKAIVILLKGIFYQNSSEKAWMEMLEGSFGEIQDYFEVIGLELIIDEVEAYAYLRNMPENEEEESLPKLINSRELSYKVSLLCVLLRAQIVNFDMRSSEDVKAVISREDIHKEIMLYLPDKMNEVKLSKEIDGVIKKVEELGFLKRLRNEEDNFEIKRAIKAFVDASWLDDFDKKLQAYKESKSWS